LYEVDTGNNRLPEKYRSSRLETSRSSKDRSSRGALADEWNSVVFLRLAQRRCCLDVGEGPAKL
jgi:hypothetical protein